ncbi:MAG: hypothetical protein ACLR7Z_04320 [Bilophila wadsworthia]
MFRQITDDTERVDLRQFRNPAPSNPSTSPAGGMRICQFTCHIKNIAELQDMIARTPRPRRRANGHRVSYNDSMVAEMRHLERADIDAACADHPVFVMHGSGHLAMSTRRRWKSATSMRTRRSPQAGRAKSTSARTASRAACSSGRRTISP